MSDTRTGDDPTRPRPSAAGRESAARPDSSLRVLLVHKAESVELVLDWLDRSGRNDREVLSIDDGFVVRWRE
jgi:hypothetical protein